MSRACGEGGMQQHELVGKHELGDQPLVQLYATCTSTGPALVTTSQQRLTCSSWGLATRASINPYSIASWGLMKKSRSVSLVMTSMGCPENWDCTHMTATTQGGKASAVIFQQ